eukprot:755562-Hanusia_phi.AAC.4
MFRRLTGVSTSLKRANSLAFSYSAGCDPKRMGRSCSHRRAAGADSPPQDQDLASVDEPVVRGGGEVLHRPAAREDEGCSPSSASPTDRQL